METRNHQVETAVSELESALGSVNKPLKAPTSPKPAVKDFTDLEVWRVSRKMRRQIYKLAKTLPDFYKFGLAARLRRATISVTANLAEGSGDSATKKMLSFVAKHTVQFTNSATTSSRVWMNVSSAKMKDSTLTLSCKE